MGLRMHPCGVPVFVVMLSKIPLLILTHWLRERLKMKKRTSANSLACSESPPRDVV